MLNNTSRSAIADKQRCNVAISGKNRPRSKCEKRAADSFHTKKLCSRLSSSEVRFYTE